MITLYNKADKNNILNIYEKDVNNIYIIEKDHTPKGKDELIKSCLKLPLLLASYYYRIYKIDYLDLVQEGNLGLIKAAESYDSTKGASFFTYASYQVNTHISREADKEASIIRLPGQMRIDIRNIQRIEKDLINKNGETPTIEEIANYFPGRYSIEKIKELVEFKNLCNVTSLDALCKEADDYSVIDSLYEEEDLNIKNIIDEEEITELVKEELEKLPEKQQYIIDHLFGIRGAKEETASALGRELNISRQRVSYIKDSVCNSIKFSIISACGGRKDE